MKVSNLSILCWQLAFFAFITPNEVKAGEYFTDFAVISADSGCSAVYYGKGNDETYDYVCFMAPVKIFADDDSVYRVTVFTGFPDEDQTSEFTHPKYRQDYSWTKYDLFTIGSNNCLYVKPRGSFLAIKDEYMPWLIRKFGPCPPTEYLWSGRTTNYRNPYLMRTKQDEIDRKDREQRQKVLDGIEKEQKEMQLKDKGSSLNPEPQQQNGGVINPAIFADNTNPPVPDSFYKQNTADAAAGLSAQSPSSALEVAYDSLPSYASPFNSFEAPNSDSGNSFTRRTLSRNRIPNAGRG